MTTERRRPGRPRTRPDDSPGDYVGFRVPRELKEQLEAAASASGRSLSTEAQFRLEASFRDQRLFDDAIDLELGEGSAGVLALLREILKRVANECLPIPRARVPGKTWMTHPVTYDQIVKAINLALEVLRPEGDPNLITAGEMIWSHGLAPGQWVRAGQINAALMLDAVIDPETAKAGLGPRSKRLAGKLGPALIDRIRAKETDKILLGLIGEIRHDAEENSR